MRKWFALTLPLALAACAAPQPVIAPQQIPPEYAGYIVAQASATAGAMATQNAGATATESVARATSTQAYLATSDSLRFAATANALHAVETAQSVAATDDASRKTQQAAVDFARATQDAVATNSQATQAADTRITQSAFIAARAERDESDVRAWSVFWSDLRDVLWYTVVALCMMACVMFAVWGAVSIRERQIDGMVRVMLRTLPPGYLAQPSFLRGMVIEALPAPARLEAPDESDAGSGTSATGREHDWKTSILRAAMYAERLGWTFDSLYAAGVIERPDWDRLTDYLRDVGLLTKRAHDRKGTRFTDGQTIETLRDYFRLEPLIPYPTGSAPLVRFPRAGTEAQKSTQTQIAQN